MFSINQNQDFLNKINVLDSSITSSSFDCIAYCQRFDLCYSASYGHEKICVLFSVSNDTKTLFKNQSTIFIKKTYRLTNGLSHNWPGILNGKDLIGGNDLFGGFNVVQNSDHAGRKNLAYEFKLGYFNVPTGVYFSGDFTIFAWVKLNDYFFGQRLIDFGNGPFKDNVVFCLNHATYKAFLYIKNSTSSFQLNSQRALRLGVWENIAVTLKGTEGSIYFNGILDARGQLPIPESKIRSFNYVGRSNWRQSHNDRNVLATFSKIKIFDRSLLLDELNKI